MRRHGDPGIHVGPVLCLLLVVGLAAVAAAIWVGHEVSILLHEASLDVVQHLRQRNEQAGWTLETRRYATGGE